MTEIREIAEDELERWIATAKAALDEADTVEGYLDWKRQARETIWLLASDEGRDVGDGDRGRGLAFTRGRRPRRGSGRRGSARRRRGVGAARRAVRLGARARLRASSPGRSRRTTRPRWRGPTRRGFVEVGRNSLLVLDLTAIEAPRVEPPDGIEVVTWAERPGAEREMYEVAREAYPDVPGEDDAVMAPFEEWLSMDMQGAGDRPEATFLALADGEVVAYAKLALSRARPAVAMHDMTGVRRAWRGRGVARALKAARDRVGEGVGLRAARDAERGAQRADPQAQRALRVRRHAGLGDGARASPRGLSGAP